MAESERLGASFSIDVTNLKTGLLQANRLIRESESEFKSAAAGMDDWSKSEEGLTAKINSLTDITEVQKKKVNALKEEYQRLIDDGLDPTSKEAVELRTKINNEEAALRSNEAELQKQKTALNNLGDATKETADETENLGDKFEALKKVGSVAVNAIAGIATACVGAVTAFLSLGESTKETQVAMAKLEQSFSKFEDGAGGFDYATETLYDLQGVLGDMDRSVEASNLLAKMSKNGEDLAANTRILTGVFAEFGDSIPTEGLAEGMQATAEMGSVQGVLADALEWQGVNLDDYNAKLEKMSSAEERAAYVQKTLTDLYGESADAYRENNKALIENNEAQLRLEQSLADIGTVALPIMTELKNIASHLLMEITPFVELLGTGLSGALNGSADAAENLAEGLSGIIEFAVNKIIELLPFVIETLVAIIPKVLSALLAELPTIIQTVLQMATDIILGLSETFPEIINTIVDIIPQLITALISSIPELLQAAITLLFAIIDAIPTIIQALIEALPQIIETIITVVSQNIPLILEAAVKMLYAIIEAIPTIIDALIVQLPTIIHTIQNTLLQNIPLLVSAAFKLFMGIITAIPLIITQLVKQVPSIGKSIIESLKNSLKNIPELGKNLIKGLWNGISDMASWIKQKIKGFGDGVLNSLKNFFGIHSPSTVMENVIGKNLALGIGKGFEKNIGAVNDKITSAMQFDGINVNANATGNNGGGVTVYQTNNYSQAHSRLELYKTKQQTAAAVRLALGTV